MTTIQFNNQLINLQDYLKNFALQLTNNNEDANDLLQDTFVKALTYKDKFTVETNFKAWVFTIMRNIFINNYRRQQRSKTFLDSTENHYHINNSVEDSHMTPESEYAVKELENGINNLDPDFSKAFKMHNDGYKYREIADDLDLTIGTVKSRIFHTRKKLMYEMGEYNTAA